jgi:MoaF N-terminal domain
MPDIPRAAPIRGSTIRFIWTEGPTKGKVHEHVFHQDGTVEYGSTGSERPQYAAFEVTKDVYAVSYLAPSGFTLTVVLDFATHEMVGVASSEDQWHPVRGTFEVDRSGPTR